MRVPVCLFLCFCCLFVSCSRQSYPYGKRPEFFFEDEKVLALCSAVLSEDVQQVSNVIADDVDLNLQGRDGITPLLWTLGTKNREMFELLLTSGADPNIQTKRGASVMGYVAAMDEPSFLKTVLKHGGNPNLVDPETLRPPLVEAIFHDRFENIKILLDHEADPNYATPMGHTVLMSAADLNRYDMAHYLLSNGADPSLATKNGDTIVDLLESDLKNPNLLRTGELFEAKGKVIDLLESNGVDVAELRQLYATPPK